MSNKNIEQLISAWLDGRISQSESDLLQQQLVESSEVRALFRKYAALDSALHGLAESDHQYADSAVVLPNPPDKSIGSVAAAPWNFGAVAMWAQLAFAAGLLIVVGNIAYQLGKEQTTLAQPTLVTVERPAAVTEKTISGHATLQRVADIEWSTGGLSYREGDVLPAGILEFGAGVVEIDFFCGATVVVEGPAKLDLESDWSVRLLAGRLRANVPPAAQGFVVKAADSEIVDLGTEFALEVGPENVRVAVMDGEIKLRGGEYDGKHLFTGEDQALKGDDAAPISFENLSTASDLKRRHTAQRDLCFENWKISSQKLRSDKRLIAYYPIAESQVGRVVPNASASGNELDGKLVGLVDRAFGRFGRKSDSLGFDRPGSRVRVRVDREFEAFTFACWVKIDSLEHLYNALFMSDGYENGELHWQIHNDGRLMFSVMVDDTPGAGLGEEPDARLHRIYFTEPIWDASKSGQWQHIASVYDPAARQVRQYVNGEEISNDEIIDRFYVQKLRIGAAEIGNWGQPFRDSPNFAVRNLDGAIDELAIFDAAFGADEIKSLYDQGKPSGY